MNCLMDKPVADEISIARELLRSHGLKRTLARVAVLRHLLSQTAPQTASQIEDAVAEHGFNQSTIYRTLDSLTKAGLVVQREFGIGFGGSRCGIRTIRCIRISFAWNAAAFNVSKRRRRPMTWGNGFPTDLNWRRSSCEAAAKTVHRLEKLE